MGDALLIVMSVSVLAMLHHFLKRVFARIEKAHEHLRAEPRNTGAELSREKAA